MAREVKQKSQVEELLRCRTLAYTFKAARHLDRLTVVYDESDVPLTGDSHAPILEDLI